MSLKSLLLLVFFIGFTAHLNAQGGQGEYIEAKRLFNNGQYSSAKGAFGALTDDAYFGNYASFYYALSAYRQDDAPQALDMLSQLLIKSPDWKGKTDVYFWLAYINLENGAYDKGIGYAEKLSELTNSVLEEQRMYDQFLKSVGLDTLGQLYANHETNRYLAYTYTLKLMEEPYENRDFDRINELNAKWNYEAHNLVLEALPTVKKESYRIGVMLPFMLDENNPEWVLQNNLVMSLYQGMEMAVQDRNLKGQKVELVAIDTKRDQAITQRQLDSLPKGYLDLIFGPLYPGPVQAVRAYSYENRINMINPLSSNSDVIGGNPYAFLFKPTYETMALELAKQADTQFHNRNAMIFYENNPRDSLFAFTYKKQIEEAGFNVVWFQELTSLNAKSVLDTLISQYDVYYTKSEADSIAAIPKRFVKERRLRQDELSRIRKYNDSKADGDSPFYIPISYNDNNKEVTYYESKPRIVSDSIGHILGATRKNFMANNLISAVETMGDSTKLFGFSEWIDFTMVSYSQLERIGVTMVSPDFVNQLGEPYSELEKRFIRQYGVIPSSYHLLGYELAMQAGRWLHKSGIYFQKDFRKGTYYSGVIQQGLKYGSANDNQVVPLVKFEKAELKMVNKDSYED